MTSRSAPRFAQRFPAVFAAALLAADLVAAPPPRADLPPGLELVVAAAAPLVEHPLMAAFDDHGRLYVADAAGLNLKRAELEAQLPNRVLRLEDRDGDGVFDHRTVFADRMTFPQGACWLDGSLYVASPPGLWKLTDTDGDGVADERTMLVGGFDYDGNAADVHGPFAHPTNGRLYWCHGRKGHRVTQRDGTLVHEGKASGIWSCRPDGSDVQWHALGSMDNPVEVDFTPEGDLFGTVNLYYNQPRGDTLMLWQYGGVYERPDQLAVLAGLPRTRERMPIVHNYGHVAVSGGAFYRSGALDPAWRGDFLATFFNTGKIVRTRLVPAGSGFTATEHEVLQLHDPDSHLTDVLEDADGSLLVIDTGGWFRIGCPSSLTAKPDLRGAIYRLRRPGAVVPADPRGLKIDWQKQTPPALAELARDPRWTVRERAARLLAARQTTPPVDPARLLDATRPADQRRACEALARARTLTAEQRAALLSLLAQPLDAPLEHAAIFAAIATQAFDAATLSAARIPAQIRRLLVALDQGADTEVARETVRTVARRHPASTDPELARTAVALAARDPRALERDGPAFTRWLQTGPIPPGGLAWLGEVVAARLAEPAARDLVAAMLAHAEPTVRRLAWKVIAEQTAGPRDPRWLAALAADLPTAADADLPALLDAVARGGSGPAQPALRQLADDSARAPAVRLKAFAALLHAGDPVAPADFSRLLAWLRPPGSPLARLDAARLLARAKLAPGQVTALAATLPQVGPMELAELLKLTRRLDAATGQVWAEQLALSPVFGSVEASVVKTAFSGLPPEFYERILAPAVRAATAATAARWRRVDTLAARAADGRSAAGAEIYARSSCVACHVAGTTGRALGPDLSQIGRIRRPRDLLESILFPDATLARDYETHAVDTADGRTLVGLIRRHDPAGLVFVEATGEEQLLPPTQIVARRQLATSLMPAGLEQTFTDQELLDLVAWLASLR
ncbi:MAG: hypothetical protein B9S34_14385 [Opitutia bacterium Tous-C1TDCM]|nr:MAG: hypothetical protein B9S34_14385 [Opitutae bacterium Tous-C1TDCM]